VWYSVLNNSIGPTATIYSRLATCRGACNRPGSHYSAEFLPNFGAALQKWNEFRNDIGLVGLAVMGQVRSSSLLGVCVLLT
jgi:hypothetical protein